MTRDVTITLRPGARLTIPARAVDALRRLGREVVAALYGDAVVRAVWL